MVKRVLIRVMPIIGWTTLATMCLWVIAGSFIDHGDYFATDATAVLAFTAAGAVVVSRQPLNAVGLLCLTSAFVGVSNLASMYAAAAEQHHLPGAVWASWLSGWIWIVGVWPVTALLPFVLPDGKVPHRFWYPVLWVIGGLVGAFVIVVAFMTSPLVKPPSLIGITAMTWTPQAEMIAWWSAAACAAAGLASLVHRLTLSTRRERSQLLWIVLAAWALVIGTLLQTSLTQPLKVAVSIGSSLAVPVALGIAVLRYDLLALNPLLKRLLLIALLATLLTVSFLLLRHLIGSDIVTATASAVGLALLAPYLHHWLGSGVSRLVYGKPGSPSEILDELRRRLAIAAESDAVLTALADCIARALPVDLVSVVLVSADRELRRVTQGTAGLPVRETCPLRFQSLDLGRIELTSAGLDQTEASLLAHLADLAAPAVAAAHRAEELRRARERLVVTREQERRRIARDLHDGLGPALSGVGFTLDALGRSLALNHDGRILAVEARTQLREATKVLRQVVRHLRPTLLDQLGLVCALRELADQHTSPTLAVEVRADDLGDLTAATEVAAYAIAAEALTNVARHASAAHCYIVLNRDGATLAITVEDDGIGIDVTAANSGIGLASMRERAEELGGRCRVHARDGVGTVVRADIPAVVDIHATRLTRPLTGVEP